MERYENMEVRGTLPQVGYWENSEKGTFNKVEFQESKMGKYVNIVVVYFSIQKLINVYFFDRQEVRHLIIRLEDFDFHLPNQYEFEGGVVFQSRKGNFRDDARNVFQALYRNSAPETEEKK